MENEKNENTELPLEDDGSLAFLKIPKNEDSRHLVGDEINQSKIVNTTFWIFNFLENVPTKYTKIKGTPGQTLVQIRPQKDSQESESKKFFTGSEQILYVLREIQKRNAFPRKVTLRGEANRYYIE